MQVTRSWKSFASASTVEWSRNMASTGTTEGDGRYDYARRAHTGPGDADEEYAGGGAEDAMWSDADSDMEEDEGIQRIVRGPSPTQEPIRSDTGSRPLVPWSSNTPRAASPAPSPSSPKPRAPGAAAVAANAIARARGPEGTRSCPNLVLPFPLPCAPAAPGNTPATSSPQISLGISPRIFPALSLGQPQPPPRAATISGGIGSPRDVPQPQPDVGGSSLSSPEGCSSSRAPPEWAAAAALPSRPRSRLQMSTSSSLSPLGAAAAASRDASPKRWQPAGGAAGVLAGGDCEKFRAVAAERVASASPARPLHMQVANLPARRSVEFPLLRSPLRSGAAAAGPAGAAAAASTATALHRTLSLDASASARGETPVNA